MLSKNPFSKNVEHLSEKLKPSDFFVGEDEPGKKKLYYIVIQNSWKHLQNKYRNENKSKADIVSIVTSEIMVTMQIAHSTVRCLVWNTVVLKTPDHLMLYLSL